MSPAPYEFWRKYRPTMPPQESPERVVLRIVDDMGEGSIMWAAMGEPFLSWDELDEAHLGATVTHYFILPSTEGLGE